MWGAGVGPVAGDAVNPSLGAWPRHPCRGHPRTRTHPAFDRFPRSATDPRHAWINLCQITKSIRGHIRFPTENGSDPRPLPPAVPRPHPTVTGKLSKAGRCRIAGCLRHGCRGQAYRDVLAASPQSDTAPPNHRQPRAALALALALALAVAGQRPALPAGAGRRPADPPSPAHENVSTVFSKPSQHCHASTILRSSMRPRATHAKNRPPIA